MLIAFIATTLLAIGLLFPSHAVKGQSTSGVVTIAFDDGKSSQISNAFPVMERYGFVGTYYIITNYVGSDGYMKLSDLNTLQNAGNEIASHGVDHPAFTYLTDDQINYESSASQQFLQHNGFPAANFAYPYGDSNSHTDSIVLQYYRSARHSYGAGYFMSIPPAATQMSIPMGFAGETGDSSALQQDEWAVNQAYETNSWVIIFFHDILPTPPTDPWQIQQSEFAALLNYVANSGVQVLTVNQALNQWSPLNAEPVVSVSPSLLTMDIGQTETFSATPSGGSGTYLSYQWYVDGVAQSGETASTLAFAPISATTYSVAVTVDDTSGATSAPSTFATVTVNDSPTVSIAPDSSIIDVGQVQTFTANSIGGSDMIHYQWYLDSSAVGPDSESYSYFAEYEASQLVTCKVTDSASNPVTSPASNAVSVKVNSALVAPTVTTASSIVDQGQSSRLTSTSIATGTSPYTYQWFKKAPSSSTYSLINGASLSSYSFDTSSSTTPGTWRFKLQVTDAAGATVNSNVVPITLNAEPVVSVSPSMLTMDIGQTHLFTSSAFRGSPPYSFQWYLNGTLISGATNSTYVFTPSTTGLVLLYLQVSDTASFPVSILSNNAAVLVKSAPVAPSLSASATMVDQGQPSQVSFGGLSGGVTPYCYQWFEKASGMDSYSPIIGATSANYSFSTIGVEMGVYSFELNVTDSASSPLTVTSTPVSVTVNSALAPPLVWAPSEIDQGQTITLTSTSVSTGTGPYSYQWMNMAPSTSSYSAILNGAFYSFNFLTSSATSTGNWSFILQVTDNAGAAVNSSASLVTVNPAISAYAGHGGYINPTGNVTVIYGGSQTFNIKADTGYNIFDVNVDGISVGAVNFYNFTNVQSPHNITATFTPTPTPTPTSAPTSSPTSTLVPAVTPPPTTTPTTTQTPVTSPKQTHSSLPQEAVYGMVPAIAIVAIGGIVLVLGKGKKAKAEGNTNGNCN